MENDRFGNTSNPNDSAALASSQDGSIVAGLRHAAAQAPASRLEGAGDGAYAYLPCERFGEGLTTDRPWNRSALAAVELLNGRVAMLGFVAALVGEWLTGRGPGAQVLALLGLRMD